MPRNYTVDVKGVKEVKLISTGYEKQRITVMLAITGDGRKLPPYIILNRKTIPKKVVPEDVVVRAQKNGWMTSGLMKDWVEVVWNERPGANFYEESMLVFDAFRGHLTDELKDMLYEEQCDLAIIPGGLTCKLQPLDVSVNKPFKQYIREEYENWLTNEEHPLTPTGKIKKAPASTVAQWVSNAWKKIPEKIIVKSFKKCCITNALDGTEDDILWQADSDSESSSSSGDESED